MMYFAVKLNSFVLLLLARAVFGIGGESLIVAQASMAERWFTGKFLSLAIGLNNVFALIGGAMAAWLGPEI
jgi:MFS family permease